MPKFAPFLSNLKKSDSLRIPSTEPITDPNSAICATLSGCKRRAVKDASPSNNYKQKEGEGQVFRAQRPTTKKMRKKADLCFCCENETHNLKTNRILTFFWF